MGVQDSAASRMAQREISRRSVDISRLDVRAMHGVVHLRGQIGMLRGHECDLKHELDVIQRILRGKPGIRDVVIDVEVDANRSEL